MICYLMIEYSYLRYYLIFFRKLLLKNTPLRLLFLDLCHRYICINIFICTVAKIYLFKVSI